MENMKMMLADFIGIAAAIAIGECGGRILHSYINTKLFWWRNGREKRAQAIKEFMERMDGRERMPPYKQHLEGTHNDDHATEGSRP